MNRYLSSANVLAFWALSATLSWAETARAVDVAAVEKGKSLFLQNCIPCHGEDGKATVEVISNATDLTDPIAYYSGTSFDEMFTSIQDGAGVGMPPFEYQLEDQEIENLVHFIRSLWSSTGE